MKTIPTKNGELLCVEVPMEAIRHEVITGCLYWTEPIHDKSKQVEHGKWEFLPINEDEYSIIGTITNGVLDFDAEPYVETFLLRVQASKLKYKNDVLYRNYSSEYKPCSSVSDSFLSILTSHNIEYSGKKLVILSKK